MTAVAAKESSLATFLVLPQKERDPAAGMDDLLNVRWRHFLLTLFVGTAELWLVQAVDTLGQVGLTIPAPRPSLLCS